MTAAAPAAGAVGERGERPLHPRHGTHDPVAGTPSRRPGSVRRTSSLDLLRPDGLLGDVLVRGRARDLHTEGDGTPAVLARARLHARIAYLPDRVVTELDTDPPAEGLAQLVGLRAASGFRARADEAVPRERAARSLGYLLLDDLPAAALVCGYALGAGGVTNAQRRTGYVAVPDLCAGWRRGGTIMLELERHGENPVVTGPAAPPLERADDPVAWHDLEPLTAHGVRRRRRLDVWPSGGLLHADCHFRDSHLSPDGVETVIHEYDVTAQVDPATGQVVGCAAVPRALPWLECPAAARSAGWLVGRAVDRLRQEVRTDFTGTATCTHLNDQLRSLADVPVLAAALPTR